jgi:hypothetical protein
MHQPETGNITKTRHALAGTNSPGVSRREQVQTRRGTTMLRCGGDILAHSRSCSRSSQCRTTHDSLAQRSLRRERWRLHGLQEVVYAVSMPSTWIPGGLATSCELKHRSLALLTLTRRVLVSSQAHAIKPLLIQAVHPDRDQDGQHSIQWPTAMLLDDFLRVYHG